MDWYWWVLIGLIACFFYGKKAEKEQKVKSLISMVKLNFILMSVDGDVDDFERKSMLRCCRRLVLDGDPGKWFADWYDEDGDLDTDKYLKLMEEIIKSEIFNLAHSDTELDERVFPIIDNLAKSIKREHRKFTIESLVELCGADLSWHPNETKLVEYIAKKIKIKKKVLKVLIDEDVALSEEVERESEEDKKSRELWRIRIQNVSIPGWKEETAQFMSELYDENLDTLLSTPDTQVANDVPGITPSKAKVLKKQMSR